MLKELLDYNSKTNVFLRSHQTAGYAIAGGIFTFAVLGVTSAIVHEVARKRTPIEK